MAEHVPADDEFAGIVGLMARGSLPMSGKKAKARFRAFLAAHDARVRADVAAERDAWREKAFRHAEQSAEKGHALHDARRRVEAVRLTHRSRSWPGVGTICDGCDQAVPCPTMRILDGEDGAVPRAIPADREVIQYGPTPDQLDEVVLSAVDVRIEQMDTNWYWMCFQRGEDRLVIHLGADRAPVNGTVIEDELNIRRTP